MAKRIRVPLPGMELGHVNAYLLECGGEYGLIDVGLATYDAAVGLLRGLKELGIKPSDIGYVFATHYHADHITLISLLSQLASPEYYMGEAELAFLQGVGGVSQFFSRLLEEFKRHGVPQQLLDEMARVAPMVRFKKAFEDVFDLPWRGVKDGEALPCGLRAVATPGHTPGHVVYAAQGYAFTGDHVLPKITPNVSWWFEVEGFNPLAEYLKSLEKVKALGRGLPAHGDELDIGKRVEEIEGHHRERLEDVSKAVEEPATAFEAARRIRWDIGPFDSLDPYNKLFAIGEALAHLYYLESLGAVEAVERGGVVVWRRKL
ncbi:MAG: MBL fold metallo-hydrolase [Thermoproteus sp. AZ2]|jgi:glyoxylase-like metal-dependent hydrolase (beta-lactamase superfamily II)|uniref:MBL fold metallo-hydrolase n=1 Tax=Thermoproteus sp. AZ2 TaxID=1609232 RepID=A0ACC6V0J5_9CREN|nr:MAG: beta-lactamase [Thermoproteus sp. AZ2]